MRGEHLLTVRNNKVQIKLPIRRNLTILKGRSATGKSTLIDLVGQFDELGPDSGVVVSCDVPCKVLSGKNWQRDLELISGSIVFIDEDNAFMRSREFAHAAKNSDNYYVLVAREACLSCPTASTRYTSSETRAAHRRSTPPTQGPTPRRTRSMDLVSLTARGQILWWSRTASRASTSSQRFVRRVEFPA